MELRSVRTNPESQDDDPSSFSLPKIVLFRSSPSSSSSSDSPKTHPDLNNQLDQTAQPKLHVISSKPSHLLLILHLQLEIPLPHDLLCPRALPSHVDGDPHNHFMRCPEVVARHLERPQRGHHVPHRVNLQENVAKLSL